ncbi:indoleacetamide hydrolase [Thauera butanivorans]|uniref:indoleacetamide hydrolase n=1 Tax=Thauera butanivorans TaxID=86174 RepID=UPI0008389C53|nr:indoleacetamide hydrolase [Thauera butanivorans]
MPASSISTTSSPGAVADIDNLTIAGAMRALADGSLSSEALVSAYIERARAHSDLNIFITLDEGGALSAARAIDAMRARGQPLGPLAGIPVVVKDNIHVAGMPSTAGTPALAEFIPAEDASVVRRLREAGAIMLGKTNMHELAFGATGYNAAFHVPGVVGVRNPYDPARIAGGSSSGSAAALGARMAPAALGTDTGGSMRIPPALNGCASLRPSAKRYPAAGIAPIASSRDTAGPMALCMADVALLDALVTGEHALPPVDLKSLRLGVVPDFWANMDTEVATVAADVQRRLKTAGVTFVEVADKEIMALNNAVGFPVVFHEAYSDMVDYLAEQGPGISIEQLRAGIASPDVAGIYDSFVLPRKAPDARGNIVDSAPLYEMAQNTGRPALRAHYRALFERHRLDAFVFPTTPVVAPLAKPDVSEPQNFALLIQNTEPSASAGLPGIQLPVGLGAKTGLPVGFELDGHAGDDRRLLAIGIALETVLGRIPPAPH